MAAAVSPAAPRTAPPNWAIDPADSVVEFAVKTFLVKTFRGRFGAVDGVIAFDETDPAAATVAAAIAAESVDTGQPRRDAHLRGADFLVRHQIGW